MSAWDYIMPHRLLINKSLRKEAEELRARIDEYQIEYDRKIEECQEEINQVESDRQEKLVQFRNSLVDELQKERTILEAVAQDITSYADAYFKKEYLNRKYSVKKREEQIHREDSAFLGQQIAYIRHEIDMLKERQRELSSFTNVEDVIRLAGLSGYEISFSEGDNAKDLLDKVSKAISNCGAEQKNERYALIRLKGIVQERSEYLSTINYIGWVVQQKIKYIKQISDKRKSIKESQAAIRQEIECLEGDIRSTAELLAEIAIRIRYYWAHPITYLNVDISYAYKEKKENGDQLREVGEELRNMASWHSDDQDKWERLQRERRDLSSEIESLKDSISSDKNKRGLWFKKRDYVFQLCKKYGVPLIPEKKTQTDEDRIIEERLAEIAQIRTEGTAEAERICEKKRADIIYKYQQARNKLELEIPVLEDKIKELDAEHNRMTVKLSTAEKKVKQIKDKDDRFFLAKMVSDPPGLESAQKAVAILKKEISVIGKTKAGTKKKLTETNKMVSELDNQHENNMRRCRPQMLRPTAAEKREEKKLLFRQTEIKKRREESGYEDKN